MTLASPLISIVTINYNGGDNFRHTVQSVVAQDHDDYEFIIVDGGSSDGSLEVIAEFEGGVDNWILEPDQGIGDAMNKGISLCRGEHILFLHADDHFLDNRSLAAASGYLENSVNIHAFDILFGDDTQATRRRPRGMSWWMNLKTGFNHQATFCSRSAFDRIGRFDPAIRVAVDYEWFLRAYRAGLNWRYCAAAVTFMRNTGVSSRRDAASLAERFAEERLIHRWHCNSPLLRAVYAVYWRLYPRYRGVVLPRSP